MKRGEKREVHPLAIERGFDLVEKYRDPTPPDELSDADKTLYREASRAMNRAWELKEILGDDLSASAAAEKYIQLAERLAACNDGSWGEESGRLSEMIKNLVSPFLDESVGKGDVLQAARDTKHKPEIFSAYVQIIRTGTLHPNIEAALRRFSHKK